MRRVVGNGDIGVERGANGQFLNVFHAVERVDESPEIVLVEADCHGVDGEVATILIVKVPSSTIGLRLLRSCRAAACAHELLNAFVSDHGGAETAVILDFFLSGQM